MTNKVHGAKYLSDLGTDVPTASHTAPLILHFNPAVRYWIPSLCQKSPEFGLRGAVRARPADHTHESIKMKSILGYL